MDLHVSGPSPSFSTQSAPQILRYILNHHPDRIFFFKQPLPIQKKKSLKFLPLDLKFFLGEPPASIFRIPVTRCRAQQEKKKKCVNWWIGISYVVFSLSLIYQWKKCHSVSMYKLFPSSNHCTICGHLKQLARKFWMNWQEACKSMNIIKRLFCPCSEVPKIHKKPVSIKQQWNKTLENIFY